MAMNARFGMAGPRLLSIAGQSSDRRKAIGSQVANGMCDMERSVYNPINMKLEVCMMFPLQAGSASTKIVEPEGCECAGDDNGHRVCHET